MLIVRTWLGRLYLAAVALTVLAYGSVQTAPLNIAALVFALLAGLSVAVPIGALKVRRVQAASILLLAGLLGYAALQVVPLPNGDLANAAWKAVNENIGPTYGTISVAPGMTLEALPSLALPFLVFISGLTYFQGDDETLRLWRMLAYIGGSYAAYGLLQELFFPEWLLFGPKKFNLESLTATFVNRNSAGEFFGIALVVNLGLEFHELRKVYVNDFIRKVLNLEIRWRDPIARVLVQALFCLIVAMALFLTKSRGAVGATFIASIAGVMLMASRRLTADRPNEDYSAWRRFAVMTGSAFVIVGLFALLAGRSIYRMEMEGPDVGRWCVFVSTIEAIKDNWLLGAGFGTFKDVFPVYRNSDCAGIFGVLVRPNNSFLEGYLGLGLSFAVALVISYAILIGVFIRGIRTRQRFRFMPVMGLCALALVSVHATVDYQLQIPGIGVYFAAVMAATVSGSLWRAGGKPEINRGLSGSARRPSA